MLCSPVCCRRFCDGQSFHVQREPPTFNKEHATASISINYKLSISTDFQVGRPRLPRRDRKSPFGGPEHVLKYLARYTHRVAISNGRLLDLANGQVRFRWRDSKHNNRIKVMSLDAVEFIRRFLLHVLPSGFVKIRHFGLLGQPQSPTSAYSLSAASQPSRYRANRDPYATAATGCPPLLPQLQVRNSAYHRPAFNLCLGHLYNAGVHQPSRLFLNPTYYV